jgi:nitrogen fixation/metabolism regulation signal transduction histidine kinase
MPDRDVMWRAFRTAREDACLGLAAVKRVVLAHGGSMETEATAWANDDAAPPWIAFRINLPEKNGDLQP